MATDESPAAVGIDLGTTYSCVAIFQHGQVEIIANDTGNRTTPSCVAFTDNERLIGEAAKNVMSINPTNTVYDAKRLIGRRFDDPIVQEDMKHWPFKVIDNAGKPNIQVDYKEEIRSFLPEEISAMVLLKMKETAEAYLRKPVKNAVVTVPAYFNDAQRRATKDAGIIAGLNVLRILNEPTAAAIAYGFRKKDDKERNVLIFDFGGGTLDVSILAIKEGIFRVKSTAGNTHLGGGDFDSRMVNHFVEEFKRKYKKDLTTSKRSLSRLRFACDRAKRFLSTTTQASIAVDALFEGMDFYSSITRARFEEINADHFQLAMDVVEKAIMDAGMVKSEIDEIVLIGGSSRMAKMQTMLKSFFNEKELIASINPDEAVAYGAAVQAAILQGDKSEAIKNLALFDVAPLSLGIDSMGNMAIVVKRNTPIPAKTTKGFMTVLDNQPGFFLEVYEGEHPLANENNLLGRFVLEGIPRGPKNSVKCDVTFEIEADGLLNVSIKEGSTGLEGTITISNDRNLLTKLEIERMIEYAERYRLDDLEHRERVEAKKALESFCLNIKEKAQNKGKDTLLQKCSEIVGWLDKDEPAKKEDFEKRKREVEELLEKGALNAEASTASKDDDSITNSPPMKKSGITPRSL